MITVHHLDNSRSIRILWLLEELGLDYEIVSYQRDSETNLAPPEMRPVSPVGKSPTIEDGFNAGKLVFESGAIIEYLVRKYGEDTELAITPEDDRYDDYMRWLQYAESSAMLPVLLKLYTGRLDRDATQPVMPRIDSELANHFGYVSRHLEEGNGREFLVGNALTGADVQMAFVVESAHKMGLVEEFPNLAVYYTNLQRRPAFVRAMAKSGEEPMRALK